MNFILRPSQIEILKYRGGKLGISAVPGSGKTFTLSALTAQIITSGVLETDQDVLVVTLVNSAVDNFAARIGKMVEIRGLIPNLGYRVRTLHGLAHDIVREKPALVGLEERFQIVDEREAEFIRMEAANAWLATFPYTLDEYLDPQLDDSKREWVKRKQLPDMVHSIALAFIRSCKNLTITPEDLRRKLDSSPGPLPLAEMGWWVYEKYQQALRYRGAVDFDDLIALAYKILQADPEYLARLQYRFPFILEDEAQDSSEIQENILRLLAGHGNWVRVGDPNQAIFETFTTADPKLLKSFIANEADHKNELPVSGRSQQHIIDLANYLIDWTNASHPAPACRDALDIPHIRPAAPDDPQPNPPPDSSAIRIIGKKYTPEEETEAVVNSIKKWLPDNKESTIAVLVPRNLRGFDVIEMLKKHKIDYVDILASTNKTRVAAGAIANVMAYLSDPSSATKLSRAYQVWRKDWRDDPSKEEIAILQKGLLSMTSGLLRKIGEVETFIAPTPDRDWLATLGESEAEHVIQELKEFRVVVNRWLKSVTLPIDQLILTLAQDLFTDAADLALAHKLALVLSQAADDHSDWRLPELTAELGVIARNERRFIGFSSDDSGFDPNAHRGVVVVTTMHKAKGLEWDRVYMMSVNNYDFPSLQPYDSYISEKWFVRVSTGSTTVLNLEAEALAQLHALNSNSEYEWYEEGAATAQSRADYSRERMRLLYVGITRAKKDLIVTWNSGRRGDAQPSLAMEALRGWWERFEPA